MWYIIISLARWLRYWASFTFLYRRDWGREGKMGLKQSGYEISECLGQGQRGQTEPPSCPMLTLVRAFKLQPRVGSTL